ncbi:alpha/beta hydrolase, partial [Streptomyces sp. SID10244]|nr:alpha/beta hydrolase [Streptomyces sp. SID10244]
MIIVLGILGLSAGPAGAAPPPKPTIVLVHGAFADATGWRD